GPGEGEAAQQHRHGGRAAQAPSKRARHHDGFPPLQRWVLISSNLDTSPRVRKPPIRPVQRPIMRYARERRCQDGAMSMRSEGRPPDPGGALPAAAEASRLVAADRDDPAERFRLEAVFYDQRVGGHSIGSY